MTKDLPASTRVLELFFELLGHSRGVSRAHLRALRGYADLSENSFDTCFDRDKNYLRDVGIRIKTIQISSDETRYMISPDSFARPIDELDETDLRLLSTALATWTGAEQAGALLVPKLLAASRSDTWVPLPLPRLELSGARTVSALATHIRERSVVTFMYPSAQGPQERSVEPWRIVLRGSFLYLWGKDLDREAPRLFRLDRIIGQVGTLGERGDAGPLPTNLPEPFASFLLSPIVACRADAAEDLPFRYTQLTEAEAAQWRNRLPADWIPLRGQEAEKGEWIQWLLQSGETVIPLEPQHMRIELCARLRAAIGQRGNDDA